MRRHISRAIFCAAILSPTLQACAGPHFYPWSGGPPTRPRAIDVGVTRVPVRWKPQTERRRLTVVKLHPSAMGPLARGLPFPILLERIAPDGTTTSFSTQHALDFYTAPSDYLAGRDGSVWFQPLASARGDLGKPATVDGGYLLAVSGDGTAWISNGDTLAQIASDGTAAYYRAPGDSITRIVGVSAGGILALDRDTHNVYRIDDDRSTWLVGSFPDLSTTVLSIREGRDAMWFADNASVSMIAGDGSELRTMKVPVPPYSTLLDGDGKALWAITQIAYSRAWPSHDAILERYAVDGTVSRFRVAYSAALSANLTSDGRLLLDAAIPGANRHNDHRHIFEIDGAGRGTQTNLSPPVQNNGGRGIARRPDGSIVFGWDTRSFATIDRLGNVEVTEIPRP